jgi:hypothetical protein
MVLITISTLFPPYTYEVYRLDTKYKPLSIKPDGTIENSEDKLILDGYIVHYGFLFSGAPKRAYNEVFTGFSDWRVTLEIIGATFVCLGAFIVFKKNEP